MMHTETLDAWRHEHVFLGARHDENERRTWLVVGLTASMMLVEIIGGTIFGSMALVADGWHMSTHAGALALAALAYRFARRHAHNEHFAFGTGKIGELAGFSSAIVLAMIALLIGSLDLRNGVMTKLLVLVAVTIAFVSPAKAIEVWTCTYTKQTRAVVATNTDTELVRFEVSPPDLIDTGNHEHYRILQNNDYGLVATTSWSKVKSGLKSPVVGARTVVVDKGTGEFWWAMTSVSGKVAALAYHISGKCLKD
jgi:hypothetical protein